MGEREALSSSDNNLHDNLETSSVPGTSRTSGNTVVLNSCFQKIKLLEFHTYCLSISYSIMHMT